MGSSAENTLRQGLWFDGSEDNAELRGQGTQEDPYRCLGLIGAGARKAYVQALDDGQAIFFEANGVLTQIQPNGDICEVGPLQENSDEVMRTLRAGIAVALAKKKNPTRSDSK